jgi:hypothetical protein
MVSDDGTIWVVQAKDISHIEMPRRMESDDAVQLDGIHRIRRRRNYRERPVFVMDTRTLYIEIIGKCEDLIHGTEGGFAALRWRTFSIFIAGFEQSDGEFRASPSPVCGDGVFHRGAEGSLPGGQSLPGRDAGRPSSGFAARFGRTSTRSIISSPRPTP